MSQTAVKSFVIFFKLSFLSHYPYVRKTNHWSQHILIYNNVSDEKKINNWFIRIFIYMDDKRFYCFSPNLLFFTDEQSNKKWNEK